MFIDCLQRHLMVCAQRDLPEIARRDPDFWNVISMREPSRPKIQTHGFKKVHTVVCYDIVGLEGLEPRDMLGVPRKEHIQSIFQFVDTIPGEPVLVHCWAGLSRSTATALALIVRAMHLDAYTDEEIRREAPEHLIAIRPQAIPNPLILELALNEFLRPGAEAHQLMIDLVNHPVFFANRHDGASPV